MTLIEVLISLTILMIVLGAVYSILSLQQSRAANVQATATLQSDAQVALTIFRWDLYMTGYAMPADTPSIVSFNNAGNSDSIRLYGAGLAFESRDANWSPVLEIAQSTNQIYVFRFPDNAQNIKAGDRLILAGQDKKLLDSGIVVNSIDTTTYYKAEDTIPALRLHISKNVSAAMGACVYAANHNTYFNGITYRIANGQLMRGNDAFLDNIEDLQFAYGIDLNDNGTFDIGNNEWQNRLQDFPGFQYDLLFHHKNMIRATIVMRSDRRLRNYRSFTAGYQNGSIIRVEDHAYNIQALNIQNFRREFVNTLTWPRNIRF
jgi:type II secretory pathway pseudopilin PulG